MRDRVCRLYLQKGFVVANVEYRTGTIAAAAEDAIRALQWFCSRVTSYGVDGNRIVVTGESAGAHLALLASFASGAQTAAVVNFYGVSDLITLLDRPAIRAVLPSQEREPIARKLSPLTYVHRGVPPVLSIHGTADQLIPPEQTKLLTRAVQEVGGQASELYIEGGRHGFSQAQQQIAYRVIFQFLAQCGVVRR
jgi:acetyl esterase/lipase